VVYSLLKQFIPNDRLFANEPMAKHTSMKVGGPADVYVQPAAKDELIKIIEICRQHNEKYIILGNASNVLIPDEGLRMVVIQLCSHFVGISCKDNYLTADAGAMLASIANLALENELSGLEFASGIPGTVGGAVCMNAGAYNHDIKDVCTSVEMLMPDGQVKTFVNSEMNFDYRHSISQENGGIVLSATFLLKPGKKDDIKEYMRDLNQRRRDNQPLEYPSVGSTFKRPPSGYASQMIDESGLKGCTVGGAQVSEKHAGFVINTGNASAQDVLDLMKHIQQKVWDDHAVMLEPEVKILCNS